MIVRTTKLEPKTSCLIFSGAPGGWLEGKCLLLGTESISASRQFRRAFRGGIALVVERVCDDRGLG